MTRRAVASDDGPVFFFSIVASNYPSRRNLVLSSHAGRPCQGMAGSVGFPLGVILRTVNRGGVFPSALAVGGSALVIMALLAAAIGFARQMRPKL